MTELLAEAGENPDKYLPAEAREGLEEERIANQLKAKYRKWYQNQISTKISITIEYSHN